MYNSAVAKASAEMLKKVPLFADLDARELEQIASSMRERRFSAGDTVTQEGAGGAGFFVVESGEAEVTVDGAARGTIGAGRLLRRDRAAHRLRPHRDDHRHAPTCSATA